MKNISKSFGALKANDNINLSVRAGEVHALLGENGAGKSTLMNMLSGIYTPDTGTIRINGQEVHFASPKESIRMGIGMIHQHFKLVDVMTAKENIIIGQPTNFFLHGKALSKKVKELSDQYGLDIDPDKKVYDMSVGEKQTLEIIKVLYRGAKILIMDEPTAVLTPQEIKKLFRVIRNMKEQGCSIVIITHKLNEVMEISDRVTVLRKGQSIETVITKEVEIANLIEMMVGKKVDLSIEKKTFDKKRPLLKMDEVTVLDSEGKNALSDVSFTLNSHEIVGVAGVANSGQKELCEVIAGLARAEKGRIYFEGDNLVGKTPRDIIRLGIRMGFIPEDRLGMGLVGSMDIVHNMILKDYQNQPGILLQRGPCVKKAKKIVKELDIQTPNIYTPVKKLSGGNVQKVLLGREIDSAPKVLITAYAVRGLDIGASYKIYDLLNEQKERGVGVLFVGEDLDVLMDLCDRVIVLCHGEITGIVRPSEVTKEDIGLLMTGKQEGEALA
ncbi:ABC transporter ATP-binding protein [Anaerovorax odorimutans]|uniref:ABC transporter ATP-binding protein n=2 Tax=Anaerovorax odorimutans TaxID=109327 RepID=A0ABT1RRN8_9FIRM|nr:ABC transporter ATP-binding protein [Anaerovorax odorimutans]MCQ4637838.1 ABC transporter ATP-binding protein [Anaerovorax odorimutans]